MLTQQVFSVRKIVWTAWLHLGYTLFRVWWLHGENLFQSSFDQFSMVIESRIYKELLSEGFVV